jgi:hypothetical protein
MFSCLICDDTNWFVSIVISSLLWCKFSIFSHQSEVFAEVFEVVFIVCDSFHKSRITYYHLPIFKMLKSILLRVLSLIFKNIWSKKYWNRNIVYNKASKTCKPSLFRWYIAALFSRWNNAYVLSHWILHVCLPCNTS